MNKIINNAKITFLIQGFFLFFYIFNVNAKEYFNPEFILMEGSDTKHVDLSYFEKNNYEVPGYYYVEIYINNKYLKTESVFFEFNNNEKNESLQPCISIIELKNIGIKTEMFPELKKEGSKCAILTAIPYASANFLFNTQQLKLNIPQSAFVVGARDYIPEKNRDNGINAFLLNYSINGNNIIRNSENTTNRNFFSNVRPGLNLGTWRVRNYSTIFNNPTVGTQWKSIYTYITRNINIINSQLVIGDSSSPSDIFDSVPFRGIQLASDDEMVPDSLKGYAPIVRGTAHTNAEVIIRQNGYIIYQSFVPAGLFEIKDMYPTGGSGDLFVTIKESDGSEQNIVVPYASLPILQREGSIKYSLTSGQYRSYSNSNDTPLFTQGTLIYGLPYGLTIYGGAQLSHFYQSAALGIGKNMGNFGALSLDMTMSNALRENSNVKYKGQSWRIRYSKNIIETGTNLSIAGYRYSTPEYLDFTDALNTYELIAQKRNRSEMIVNQSLGEKIGSISLSWVEEDYWNERNSMRSIGLGYLNSWNGINYGINYFYNQNSSSKIGHHYDADQQIAINISLPLDKWMNNSYGSFNINSSKNGNSSYTTGVNGTAFEDNSLSWGIQQSHTNNGGGNSGSINTNYRSTYGEISSGYNYDKYNQQFQYGARGGIIIHEDGITFGQSLGETIVLVKVPEASGVSLNSGVGVSTDWRGYTIVPYASPYRNNLIQLNTESLPENIDIEIASQSVVPTRGAVVRANFDTQVGRRVLMTVHKKNGEVVPFGASVTDIKNNPIKSFIVDDHGKVYLTGSPETGLLNVQWGTGTEQHCRVKYSLKNTKQVNGIILLEGLCE
ncbi:fimbria/pilus outer membrane usher protein [Morganella morganii]|uniref:fimbria/pilus outer membrane usher protein n=1 Tax=Morganella morganii TaxID=582 RepID=UPI0004686826|nr:fimbria/pilus outer membrane usher protein [Morganella morganii]